MSGSQRYPVAATPVQVDRLRPGMEGLDLGLGAQRRWGGSTAASGAARPARRRTEV
jgi:hypothetical protein